MARVKSKRNRSFTSKRQQKILRCRRAIANDTYEDDRKLNIATARLLDDLLADEEVKQQKGKQPPCSPT
jgi:hypothetical protein